MIDNLSPRLINTVARFAKENNVNKVILFGSRARGTNSPRSDVDIAVSGGDFDAFYLNVKEQMPSLLSFDVVSLDSAISAELKTDIIKDGITLYEKAG